MFIATYYVVIHGTTAASRQFAALKTFWSVFTLGISRVQGRSFEYLSRLGLFTNDIVIKLIQPSRIVSFIGRDSRRALLCRRAGVREIQFVEAIFGLQVGLSLLCLVTGFLALVLLPGSSFTWVHIFGLLALPVAGYYVPELYLNAKVKARQRSMATSFPDALDLIMICVESGLSLDASIQRVGDEFRRSCPALYDEFRLLTLELRSGVPRAAAFQNLASRIDLRDISNVIVTLTQADRFGTSLSDAVRVQAEQLRLHRKLTAEEHASKISTKLLFPLVFCLFPSLFLVLLGPAILTILESFPMLTRP